MNHENLFRAKFQKLLKERYGSRVYMQKHHGSEYSAGLPDLFVLHRSGPLFFELKAVPGHGGDKAVAIDFRKTPTGLQSLTMQNIERACGGTAMMLVYFKHWDKIISVWGDDVWKCREASFVLTHGHLNVPALSNRWAVVRDSPDPLTDLRQAATQFSVWLRTSALSEWDAEDAE